MPVGMVMNQWLTVQACIQRCGWCLHRAIGRVMLFVTVALLRWNFVVGSRIILVSGLLSLLLISKGINAAEISVEVRDKQLGQALSGASVCLGTPANPVQFGGYITDESGYAVFGSVPETPLVLTVSRPDYTGYQRNLSARQFDITLKVGMLNGGLGPVCDLGEPVPVPKLAEEAVTIQRFQLGAGEQTTGQRDIPLTISVSGVPTHYRVAEHWDFRGAEWQDWQSPMTYRLSAGRGQKDVYLQIRRLKSLDGGEVESVSGIARASVYLNRQ